MNGKDYHATVQNRDLCFCNWRTLGRWHFGVCASAGGADGANNVSGAGHYFPGEYGEQRQSASGRRSEDEEFERIVEVEQRRKHAAKEKRR